MYTQRTYQLCIKHDNLLTLISSLLFIFFNMTSVRKRCVQCSVINALQSVADPESYEDSEIPKRGKTFPILMTLII